MLIESPAMDLIRHLRFFVTVAEEGHFGRAAAVLDMTQPPLSQGLRKLEQHLGSELVHRTRQGAVLTPAGAELLPRARLLVDDADRFLAEAGRVARARGLLHWGATRVLPDRLVTLCVTVLSRRGEATVATRSASTVELVDAVRSGMCDLAVVEHPTLTEGLEAGPVVKLRRWLVVPADHRSARSDRPRLPMLSDLTFAAPPRTGNPAAFDAAQDLLRERGLDVETSCVLPCRATPQARHPRVRETR
ncbi:LysR family transcriptional regulator [Rhodococcus pyridinivorans]|uniref:LysR family transcriptional regulator n=1 Tax=Rhodococcus pyridinivorans TaxID=103816 RepID=UPI001E6409DB|nr:LysR family transcriptional regulator [Rhodococcus pyridinivorans]MCD5421495.1 LysR family transcriptional regulator [Rhodococcus pyridinivorans]